MTSVAIYTPGYPVSKLSYLGERSEPREKSRASGPRFRVSSRASTFHDIPQMKSLLAG